MSFFDTAIVHGIPSKKRANETGVALITALLIVAIAASTAVATASRQYRDIRQTSNLLGRDQAYLIALGGEFWAKQVLTEDAEKGDKDTLDETWSQKPAAISVQGGTIVGRIHDGQAGFNLNNIIDTNGKQNPVAMTRLQRLLSHLNLNPSLASALADWIDANDETNGPDGAENDTYLSLDPSYYAGNRPLIRVSELNLVEGFDATTVEKLMPFVTVLPKKTPVNINTASVEILRILGPELSMMDAQTLADFRGQSGFPAKDELEKHPVLKDKGEFFENISFNSNYFRVSLKANVGRGQVQMFSLLGRKNKRVTLLHRRLE